MCAKFFEGLFGSKPVAPAAPATTAIRETRKSGQVKAEAELGQQPAKKVSGGGNSSIGIAIGTPDTPRKRTTELGL